MVFFSGVIAASFLLNLNEKNLEASVEIFSELSDGYPKHQLAADARLQQGMLLVNLGRFDNAQKALEKFITEHREDKRVDQVNYQLGLILMDQKLWQPASVKFSKVPKESVWRDEALYQLAWCEKRTARKPLAISYYKELLADYKDSPLINSATLELAELEFEGKSFRVTLSGGVVSYPLDAQDTKSLIHAADIALYQAKENGRNRICLHDLDKRHYIRIDFAGEIQVNKVDQESEQIKVRGKNFSNPDLLFESPVSIEIGTQV